ncbi:MAG: DUF393 domain-containing protein, partial [Acidobacteriales bacterium]|nr:DUF393 domain-containing protein [Terriglobales bacterium]
LFVLYDPDCGLCRWAKDWMLQQPKFLEMNFVAAGTAEGARQFPSLTRIGEPPEELILVDDRGGVYREGEAWLICLWALKEYRGWSYRLATPRLLPLARQAFHLLSRNRSFVSQLVGAPNDSELARVLQQEPVPHCSS